jgi:hypothetical protein
MLDYLFEQSKIVDGSEGYLPFTGKYRKELRKLRKWAPKINERIGLDEQPRVIFNPYLPTAGQLNPESGIIQLNPDYFWMVNKNHNVQYGGFRDTLLNVYAHEAQHYKQVKEGRLVLVGKTMPSIQWKHKASDAACVVYRFYNVTQKEYRNFPWEIEANNVSREVVRGVLDNAEAEVSETFFTAKRWLPFGSFRSDIFKNQGAA